MQYRTVWIIFLTASPSVELWAYRFSGPLRRMIADVLNVGQRGKLVKLMTNVTCSFSLQEVNCPRSSFQQYKSCFHL